MTKEDWLFLVGCGFVVGGAFMVYVPLGMVCIGVPLIGLALSPKKAKPQDDR